MIQESADERWKFKTTLYEAGEVAQWEKVFAAKPDDLSSISRDHLVEEGDCFPQVVLWFPHAQYDMSVYAHMHTRKQ